MPKKKTVLKKTAKVSPIIQFAVVFLMVSAIALVAFAFKYFTP